MAFITLVTAGNIFEEGAFIFGLPVVVLIASIMMLNKKTWSAMEDMVKAYGEFFGELLGQDKTSQENRGTRPA